MPSTPWIVTGRTCWPPSDASAAKRSTIFRAFGLVRNLEHDEHVRGLRPAPVDGDRALLREEREEVGLDREAERLLELRRSSSSDPGTFASLDSRALSNASLEVAERDVRERVRRQDLVELRREAAGRRLPLALVRGLDRDAVVLGAGGERDRLELAEALGEPLEIARVGALRGFLLDQLGRGAAR